MKIENRSIFGSLRLLDYICKHRHTDKQHTGDKHEHTSMTHTTVMTTQITYMNTDITIMINTIIIDKISISMFSFCFSCLFSSSIYDYFLCKSSEWASGRQIHC